MKTLVEVTQQKEEPDEEGNPVYERSHWWLLYFGLEYKMVETEQGLIPVNYTACICSNYETGQVETFSPSQIKILGKEVKEL